VCCSECVAVYDPTRSDYVIMNAFRGVDDPDAYTGWPRCTGYLLFLGQFPQKSPMLSGSLAERKLEVETSYASLQS